MESAFQTVRRDNGKEDEVGLDQDQDQEVRAGNRPTKP